MDDTKQVVLAFLRSPDTWGPTLVSIAAASDPLVSCDLEFKEYGKLFYALSRAVGVPCDGDALALAKSWRVDSMGGGAVLAERVRSSVDAVTRSLARSRGVDLRTAAIDLVRSVVHFQASETIAPRIRPISRIRVGEARHPTRSAAKIVRRVGRILHPSVARVLWTHGIAIDAT